MARSAVRRQVPMTGAQCGNPARWDLCGGPSARTVPTATNLTAGTCAGTRRVTLLSVMIDLCDPPKLAA
jgi:hypothetical protein